MLVDRVEEQDWRAASPLQCAACKLQLSPLTGTLFHDSHLPLSKWFAAISLMCDAKKGISASQLQRHLGVTYTTARYVAQRIREGIAGSSGLMDSNRRLDMDWRWILPSRSANPITIVLAALAIFAPLQGAWVRFERLGRDSNEQTHATR